MEFIDLRAREEEPRPMRADLCIVGSGPAGASIAKELAGLSISVLVIEGGGKEETPANQALYEVENVGVARMTPQQLVRNRVLGGSSHTWTGRCVSFNSIDFESRSWVPHSGWPIGPREVLPFLERAREYLGIGPNVYDEELWKNLGLAPAQPLIDPSRLATQFWQFSKDSYNAHEPARFARTIDSIDAPNIKVLTHANVTQVNTSTDGTRVESVEIRTLEGKRFEVAASMVVIACGGIENARLLLASNRISANGVGNAHDLVGRFLMDHPRCTLGFFDPQRSTAIQDRYGHYWLAGQNARHVYLHGVSLSPEVQRKEHLLNCAAFLEELPSDDDPWLTMKRLMGGAKNEVQLNPPKRAMHEVLAVISHPRSLLSNAYRRVVLQRAPIITARQMGLVCLVEQMPDANSRVTLSDRTDVLGMPISRIDWRIGELEWRSVLRLDELMRLELRRLGLPEHSQNPRLSDAIDWRSNFIDRAHPSGTTRMATSPRHGVVDQNCQVHGVEGLYIAGSSVFPTAGHGNPTLMVVAMAIRLADHLKQRSPQPD